GARAVGADGLDGPAAPPSWLLGDQDRQRIGLLSGRTPGRPDREAPSALALASKLRKNPRPELVEHRPIAEEIGLVVEERFDDLLGQHGLVRLTEPVRERLERSELVLPQYAGERGADPPQAVGGEFLPGTCFEQAGDDAERVFAMVHHAALMAATTRAAICSGGRTAAASPAEATAPGMPQTAEVAASCAKIVPPAATSLAAPSAPSRPIPDSTMPIACGP